VRKPGRVEELWYTSEEGLEKEKFSKKQVRNSKRKIG
jgi:hypothetical protein